MTSLKGIIKYHTTYFSPMQVWDLASMSLVPPTMCRVECKVWMLALAWPHVFVVGGTDWKGFKVFNMVTGQLVRNVQVNCITY